MTLIPGRRAPVAPVGAPSRPLLIGLTLLPLVAVGLGVVWPLGAMVERSIRLDGQLDLAVLSEVARSGAVRSAVWFSTWMAAVSAFATVVVALPAARVMALYRFRGDQIVGALGLVPFVLPTVVVGTAFWSLLGPSGPLASVAERLGVEGLDARRSVWAVLMAHVFFNHAVVVRTVSSLWRHLDPRLVDAARTLGAGPWARFRHVTWPFIAPAVAASAVLVFLFSFTSFGVVLVLGDRGMATVEVEIFRQLRQLDLGVASVLALVQLGAMTVVLGPWSRWAQRRSSASGRTSGDDHRRRPGSLSERWEVALNLLVMALLLGVPIASLVERSLRTADGWGLDHYRSLLDRGSSTAAVDPIAAIVESLRVATLATLITVVLGVAAARVISTSGRRWVRWFDLALMVPLGASAVTVGLGLLITFDEPPLDLRGSPYLVPFAQALVALPFVVRILVPVLAAVDDRVREAAAVLGAAPGRIWRSVELPLVGRALGVAAGFGFAISLGEFGAASVLARSGTPTLPVAIFRLLGRPGAANLGQAMALSTILVVVTAVAVLASGRLRGAVGSDGGGFGS